MTRALRAVPPPSEGDAGDLSTMPDKYLQCREMGHSWRNAGRDAVTRSYRGKIVEFTRELLCSSCSASAVDTYETTWFSRVGKRKITYPDGYLTKGHGRVPRAEARRALFDSFAGKRKR